MKSLTEIENNYSNILNSVLSTEEQKYSEWDKFSDITVKSLEFEKEVFITLTDSLYKTQGKVVYSDIIKSSAEFAYLASLVNQGKQGDLVTKLKKAFHVNFFNVEFSEGLLGQRMFLKLSVKELREFLIERKLPDFSPSLVDEKFLGEIEVEEGEFVVVAVKGEKKAVATANPVLHFWSKGEIDKIVIEFVMVISWIKASDLKVLNEMNEDERIIDVISDSHNLPAESLAMIKNLEREIFEKFADHERRVWGELEPSALSKYKMQQDELTKLHDSLQSIKLKIDQERSWQEKILIDMREALIGNGGPKLY